VDALFRSAAESYGPRVVGVVLSGNLDDGTAGLRAIKERGGVAIVQDPENAMYSGMPGNALKYVEVDHCLPLSEIGPLLDTLARDPVADRREMYPQEVTTAMKEETGLEPFFALTCPECHSSLLDNYSRKVPQFVCRVGHTYTPEGLLSQQSEALEQGLWSALRAVEERLQLTRLLSTAYYEDDSVLRRRLEEKAEQTLRRVEQLKAMLVDDDDWYSVAELFDAPSTIRNSDWTISADR
jgi:two-component system chemotaxis response regulator CheB